MGRQRVLAHTDAVLAGQRLSWVQSTDPCPTVMAVAVSASEIVAALERVDAAGDKTDGVHHAVSGTYRPTLSLGFWRCTVFSLTSRRHRLLHEPVK